MSNDLADQIRVRREAKGLKQDAFADLAGIPERTYQDYEGGKRAIPSDRLPGIVRALGCTFDEIFGVSETPSPEHLTRLIRAFWLAVPARRSDILDQAERLSAPAKSPSSRTRGT